MRIRHLVATLLLPLPVATSDAQKTGDLLTGPAISIAGVGGSLPPFAALVFDPSAGNAARTSNWTASFVATTAEKEARLQANLCDVPFVERACTGRNALHATLAGPIQKDGPTMLANLNGLAGQSRIEAGYKYNMGDQGLTLGLDGAFSQPTFRFRDPATLASQSVTRRAGSIGLLGGYKSNVASIHVGARHESRSTSADAQEVCTPAAFGPAGTMTCSDLVIGGPSTQNAKLASVDLAYSIGLAAAHVIVTHDFTSEVTGIDIPIHVIPGGNGGLAGGVRLGYRSDSRQWTVALFVAEFKL